MNDQWMPTSTMEGMFGGMKAEMHHIWALQQHLLLLAATVHRLEEAYSLDRVQRDHD